ncbi:hypothetical protein [Haliscomenobacter sp.]|uniref:hypothetical protein n=1 Tax=Haliscomenobacter sp. TaxID=2717303 RepID=UPI003BACDF27
MKTFSLFTLLILLLLWSSKPMAQSGLVPDFTKPAFGLTKTVGSNNVLAILWNPERPGEFVPDKNSIEKLLFGPSSSVSSYYSENSGNKFTIRKAAVLGWYQAKQPWQYYWRQGNYDPNNLAAGDQHLWVDVNGKYGQKYAKYYLDAEGFIHGHRNKYMEAVRMADNEFNFKAYDLNKDGVLSPNELAIIIIIPQNGPFGTKRSFPVVVGRQIPDEAYLTVDGVQIHALSEAYIGNPISLGTAAHELAHLIFNADDMYFNFVQPYAAGPYSLMDQATSHLDPFHKLKLGWLNPKVVKSDGWYEVKDIATSFEALILYDPKRGSDEYFIIENRWKGTSYNKLQPFFGIAIWHIIENPAIFNNLPCPLGVNPNDWVKMEYNNWGRRSIRMIRPIYGPPIHWELWDGTNKTTGYDISPLNNTPGQVNLQWADGTNAPFEISSIPPSSPNMKIKISGVSAPIKSYISTPGVGDLGQGAGVAFANLNGNIYPDLIVMAYEASQVPGQFKYKVGFDVDAKGQPKSWSPVYAIDGVGMAEGAGLAIGDIDNNNQPDLILMAYADKAGRNEFCYRVGKNLNYAGIATQWGEIVHVEGLGAVGDGAGIALYDLDKNKKLDIVLMAYDGAVGGNQFRYKVGKNIDTQGKTSIWSNPVFIPGVGDLGEGAGLAFEDLDKNGLPELIFMAYDSPNGDNNFRYKIGWDVDQNGVTTKWPLPAYYTTTGVGDVGEGADLAIYDIDLDGKPEAIFMAYDAPKGKREFRYKVVQLESVFLQ